MTGAARILLAGLMSAWCASAHAQGAPPPPVEAYGRLPAIGDAAISPDGTHLALSVGFDYRAAEPDRALTAFRIINIDTGAVEHTFLPEANNTFRGVGWADDQHPFYYVSGAVRPGDMDPRGNPWAMPRGGKIEWFRVGVMSLATQNVRILMNNSQYWGNIGLTRLYAPIEGDPGFGRMIAWGGLSALSSDPRLALFRIDLETGAETTLEAGGAQTRGMAIDSRGGLVARVDIDERTNRWRIYAYDGDDARVIMEDISEMGYPIVVYGLLPDGRLAAVKQFDEAERDKLLAIDRSTGAVEVVYDAEGSDVGVIVDPWTREVVGAAWAGNLFEQKFFDPGVEALSAAVGRLFEDGYANLVSWSQDRRRILVFGERAGDAGAYYVFEPATNALRMVGRLYPELNADEAFGERQSITYRARDGTRIPAYLTLPVGVEPRNLPLVLLVHGGPHARDSFAFDWWASFLASRGYAVLQANYRGSTGYGYDWFDAGRGQWGDGLMQTDVEDGMDALVRNGIADRARVCIIGGSYGGYAALAGATLTPERYACAASINGLTDPVRLLNESRRGQYGGRGGSAEWWSRSMGADDMEHLRRVTPVDHADAVRAPILIIHGKDDSVVPIQQSRMMNDRLRGADKDVRFVELDGDDHWLSEAPTRTRMLSELEGFLAEHLGAR